MKVKKIIENMKINNGGVDKINAKTLEAISEHIADSLAHINKCIEKSIWPDAYDIYTYIHITIFRNFILLLKIKMFN